MDDTSFTLSPMSMPPTPAHLGSHSLTGRGRNSRALLDDAHEMVALLSQLARITQQPQPQLQPQLQSQLQSQLQPQLQPQPQLQQAPSVPVVGTGVVLPHEALNIMAALQAESDARAQEVQDLREAAHARETEMREAEALLAESEARIREQDDIIAQLVEHNEGLMEEREVLRDKVRALREERNSLRSSSAAVQDAAKAHKRERPAQGQGE
ncbi:uncharacterized protein AMSG_04346 [Thecamonas trahens ATCC 50062]|uniref:Uncharacterized protein n=1 Tax=Thecamonas trahens ATCC 50062 TaxID=461836 RepID=A0A0L0D7T1_THETB|nr:hypothetical protein AMSG_04346 [Thecamonas trahens ATCC 50062]KNC48116.1 hypothetical protein AMSG_04346 [Thecamonas trahens ATCC 50062]|eukprot:XP_013758689.1 hypothetical protein AMSG_04346 [Thecamonas trahens ATCC 50062]